MNNNCFDLIQYIYENGYKNQREIKSKTNISLGSVNNALNTLKKSGYLSDDFQLTNQADALIKRSRCQRAIILAAGFGLRMVPINLENPKGLIKVNNQTLIERLINQLLEKNISDIYVVVGYQKEKYEFLIDQYHVKLIYNPHFKTQNNLSSLIKCQNLLSNCLILPCDLYFYDNPFSNAYFYSFIAKDKHFLGYGFIKDCDYLMVSELLKNASDYELVEYSWDQFLYKKLKKNIVFKDLSNFEYNEINTIEDLREIDEKSHNLKNKAFEIICTTFNIDMNQIKDIEVLKKGMTNSSFIFSVDKKKYIMRIPGIGSQQLINRHQEYQVYQVINDYDLADRVIYIDKDSGYKITEYINDSKVVDPLNSDDLKRAMNLLKYFHQLNLQVDHQFDLLERINYYESLRNGKSSIYKDYELTKENVFKLIKWVNKIPKNIQLCHIDANHDNFLISADQIKLIDWEYGANSDPHLDIAMFAIYALYDLTMIDYLIDIYFEDNCPKETRYKIYAYIAIAGLLWSNWCEYKLSLGYDFGEYSLKQYRYSKEFYELVIQEYEL